MYRWPLYIYILRFGFAVTVGFKSTTHPTSEQCTMYIACQELGKIAKLVCHVHRVLLLSAVCVCVCICSCFRSTLKRD